MVSLSTSYHPLSIYFSYHNCYCYCLNYTHTYNRSGRFKHSQTILLLATAIYCIVDPVAKAATSYDRLRIRSLARFRQLSACLVVLSASLVTLSAFPTTYSIYQGGVADCLPVLIYMCIGILFGYSNTCMFRVFKERMSDCDVQNAYRLISVCTQLGAFVGTFGTFMYVIIASSAAR